MQTTNCTCVPSQPCVNDWDVSCRNLGDVSTNHHAVSLRVKSLLDSCNEGLDEHENSDQSSTQADGEDEAGSVMQVDAFSVCPYQVVLQLQHIEGMHLCRCASEPDQQQQSRWWAQLSVHDSPQNCSPVVLVMVFVS